MARERSSWRQSGQEKSIWVTKVGGVGDGAPSITGVQVKGGLAPTGPSMEEL